MMYRCTTIRVRASINPAEEKVFIVGTFITKEWGGIFFLYLFLVFKKTNKQSIENKKES